MKDVQVRACARSTTALFLGAALLALTARMSYAATYTVQDLGSLGGTTRMASTQTFALGINSAGEVVGQSLTATGQFRAFSWTSAGGMTELGASIANSTGSGANAISDNGEVVGNYDDSSGAHAIAWENGSLSKVGPPVSINSNAYDVNLKGQVVGWATYSNNPTFPRAFLFDNGTATDLGTLGGNTSRAYGINNSGQVVGESDIAGNTGYHAFLWSNGKMSDLGGLGGNSVASYISGNGAIVGLSYLLGSTNYHAVLWANGAVKDLGTLGGTMSFAEQINANGQIVGAAYLTGNSEEHAVLWQNGFITDLNSLVSLNSPGYLQSALFINGSGQIVAQGSNGHAYLLSPVPEPQTYALMLAGLGLVSFVARRRMQHAD